MNSICPIIENLHEIRELCCKTKIEVTHNAYTGSEVVSFSFVDITGVFPFHSGGKSPRAGIYITKSSVSPYYQIAFYEFYFMDKGDIVGFFFSEEKALYPFAEKPVKAHGIRYNVITVPAELIAMLLDRQLLSISCLDTKTKECASYWITAPIYNKSYTDDQYNLFFKYCVWKIQDESARRNWP